MQRCDPDNALFVCWNCHNIVDDKKSVHIYTEAWLKTLRAQHHEIARTVFERLVPPNVSIIGGSLETDGIGDVAAVRVRNASAIFKDGFFSRTSGVGRVTNIEITNDVPGVGASGMSLGVTGSPGSQSFVRTGGPCPVCGVGRGAFSVHAVRRDPSTPDVPRCPGCGRVRM
jgi:hypothetical protein